MTRTSAGLLLYEFAVGTPDSSPTVVPEGALRVLLVHPGGPFWARRDAGAWSLPKGEHDNSEDPHEVALREFHEELGSPAPPPAGGSGPDDIDLGEVRLAGGKRVRAWARRASFDAASCRSNTFEIEWPKGSGVIRSFPEVDRAEWFDVATARRKLNKAQVAFLDRLLEQLGV